MRINTTNLVILSKRFIATSMVILSLFSGATSAVAADSKEAAIARAQAQANFQSQMNSYVTAHRAIIDTRRAAGAKALADFQVALTAVTTEAQLQTAKDARRTAVAAATAIAEAAHKALVKPLKPVKPVKTTAPTAPTA